MEVVAVVAHSRSAAVGYPPAGVDKGIAARVGATVEVARVDMVHPVSQECPGEARSDLVFPVSPDPVRSPGGWL